ncbi:MAG TPA: translocation/assembly module TamB domain-containing protein [Verrucomicrobiae bacterium]|jgi:translocation and assembly module TamB|nr:translocation/assembly module TamB domain-containing protein [Verrucomicrobiae bacterium]
MTFRLFRRSKKSAPGQSKQPKQKKPRSRGAKWFRRIFLTTLLALLVALGVYWKVTLPEQVRRRVIAELELMTGGTVEIQSLTWKLSTLEIDIAGLTIHGREGPVQAPYVHVDHLHLQVKFSSLFSSAVRLQYVYVDHPVFHLIINPDGTTNQPEPKIARQSSQSTAQQLFELAVNRVDIRNGELLLNERKLPFGFSADRVAAAMNYSPADKTYDGTLSLGLTVARNHDGGPLRGDVDLHFLLHPTFADLKSLNLRMDSSTVQATGTVGNYGNPEVHLRYQASLDLPQLVSAARAASGPRVQAGRLDLNGTAAYVKGRYALQGDAAVHNLGWRDASLRVSGVEISSPFDITPEQVLLPKIVAHAFGGTAQGEAKVLNWTAPDAGHKSPVEQGSVTLTVAAMQVRPLVAAVSSPRLPLEKINLAGSVFGSINVSWTGSPLNSVAVFKLNGSPPANPAADQVPLTARLQATYHRGSEHLDVASFDAATRRMRLNAAGTLGAQNTQIKVAFDAADLHELQPLLDALGMQSETALAVHGRTSFNGTVFGKLGQPSASGHVEIADFDTSLQPTAKQSDRMHWDTGAADINYTPAQLAARNGVLRRAAAQFAFSGSASLDRGQFNPRTSQITADIRAKNANLADMQSMAGSSYPVTGLFNGSFNLTGTLRDLRGSGSLQASQMIVYGEPFRSLRADISFTGNEIQLRNVLLSHNGSLARGTAAFNRGVGTVRFDLQGSDLELASLQRWQTERVKMAGKADFHLTGGGTLREPVINGHVNFHHLVLNGEDVGDLSATAETHGADMQVRARSNFQNAMFSLDGTVRLRDNFPAQMTVTFEHLDLDPLIRAYFQGRLTGHSTIAGSVKVQGPLATPRDLAVTANIAEFSADVENVKMQNSGPIRFSMSNKAARIDQFHVVGPDMDFTVKGTAQLDGPRALDLHAEGRADLRLLRTLYPDVASSGAANFTVGVVGNMGQPQMRGQVDLSDGVISVAGLPNGLSQIKGRMVFAQDRMQIETLTAHTGGGTLMLGGFIAYRNGVYFDVTANGSDVRLRYPPGVSASADASLRYTGSAQSSLLSGDVTILRFAMNPHFDFAQYLARGKNALTSTAQNPFLDNMRLDVHVVSTPELRVETSLAKLSGDANLRIRGTMANPGLLGRVNIAEGDISFSGTKYRLQRGDITFNNPLAVQPVIDVEMAARVQGYEITIGFHGSFDRLNITYRSDPPLPSSDIIALLAFGRTRKDSVYTTRTITTLDAPSAVVLDQALNSASNSRLQKVFGVGRIKIDPQAGGPENNPSTRVTIEQQFSNNITLTYLTNVAQSQSQQVIQMEYNINRNLSIVAVRDQNGILGFDVHFRQRKK